MPEGGLERVAVNEQAIRDLRADLAERRHEEERTRDRLHKLEGAVGLLVSAQKEARRAEDRQYRRLEVRLQRLAVAVAVGSFLVSAAMIVVAIVRP